MKRYWHMQTPDGKIELIQQGFSWTAIGSGLFGFFPLGMVFWLLYRRLWLLALVWFGLMIVFSLPAGILEQMLERSSGGASVGIGLLFWLAFIPYLLMSLALGKFGNQWTMLNRLKKGYIDKGEVEAASEIEAIRQVNAGNQQGVYFRS